MGSVKMLFGYEQVAKRIANIRLMDIMMPVMNGYEATKMIRSLDREDAKEIPIIAMTANAFTEDRIRAKEAGMDEHIAKPVDVELLIKVIHKLVEYNGYGSDK
ncbi:MAG: response regulator [Blautia massiliensis (ex Durand et al. 2017)]|uniref:response regulator n=1 Tax=Blautia TaxID=572511 RepID=UPI00241C3B16